jgi:hypothetical protein
MFWPMSAAHIIKNALLLHELSAAPHASKAKRRALIIDFHSNISESGPKLFN